VRKLLKIGIAFLVLMAGCAANQYKTGHTYNSYNIHNLKLKIPSKYKASEQSVQDPAGDMLIYRWKSLTGGTLEVLVWPTGPRIERGPMVVDTEEVTIVANQQTKLIKASIFFGNKEEVLVVHLKNSRARYLINSKNININEFKSILNSAEIVDN